MGKPIRIRTRTRTRPRTRPRSPKRDPTTARSSESASPRFEPAIPCPASSCPLQIMYENVNRFAEYVYGPSPKRVAIFLHHGRSSLASRAFRRAIWFKSRGGHSSFACVPLPMSLPPQRLQVQHASPRLEPTPESGRRLNGSNQASSQQGLSGSPVTCGRFDVVGKYQTLRVSNTTDSECSRRGDAASMAET